MRFFISISLMLMGLFAHPHTNAQENNEADTQEEVDENQNENQWKFGRLHVFSGGGYGENYHISSIIHWLPNSDFNQSGLSLRLRSKILPKENVESDIAFGTDVGYRSVSEHYKWGIFLGPAWARKWKRIYAGEDSMGNAYYATDMEEKTSIAIMLNAHTEITENWQIIANFNYDDAIKEGWIEFKPHYKNAHGIRIGITTLLKHGYNRVGKKYDYVNTGIFFSDMQIPWFTSNHSLRIGGEILTETNIKTAKTIPYFGINLGMSFNN